METLESTVSEAPSAGRFYATKCSQNGLPIYNLTIPMGTVALQLSRPFGPEKPLEGNRRMDANHALAYAEYVISRAAENKLSYTPALSLRSSDGDVTEIDDWIPEPAQRMSRGVIEISIGDLIPMEGQHRIYGTRERLTEIKDAIAIVKRNIEAAKKQESPAIADLEKSLRRLEDAYKALNDLPVTVEILPITSELDWQQLFADVAQNAQGIKGDVKTWFDQTKAVNRVARRLIESHPIFVGKTEVGTELPTPYWIKADGVAKLVHAVDKGVGGRYSAQDERRANDGEIYKKVVAFLDDAIKAFPLLNAIAKGTPEYADERRKEKATSMILSLSMLRGLAGAHRRLREAGVKTVDFTPLIDKMGVPIDAKFWQKIAPTAFEWGTPEKPANPTAPGGRGGNIIALANGIAEYLGDTSSS
jgi:hypothetical protein